MTPGGGLGYGLPVDESEMTLARDWDFRDCVCYFWQEKFDGCRAYWDGASLWTRDGNAIQAPDSFLSKLPAGVHLDGEVWCGRGAYIEAMTAVRHGKFTDSCRFVAFDVPQAEGNWLKRIKHADGMQNEVVVTSARGKIGFRDEPSELAASIIAAGGEGLMLRNPDIKRYERKRTINLMRVKAKNLYAPWHGLKDTRPAPVGTGFDINRCAFDPEIAWKINAALHDDAVDYSDLKA
jgi:DNA ligase-1